MEGFELLRGHRERLRQRFLSNPDRFTETELLELILIYAIPRRDVRPLAEALVDRFGSLAAVLQQDYKEIIKFPGLGQNSACLLKAIAAVKQCMATTPQDSMQEPIQNVLPGFPVPKGKPNKESLETRARRRSRPSATFQRPTKTPGVRSFTNDLVDVFLKALPQAARFSDLLSYRDYLYEHLPFNAETTRERYAQYLINRFFPSDVFSKDIVSFADAFRETQALKDVIFYMTAMSEPIVAKVSTEVVWPSASTGTLSKTQLLNGVDARLHLTKPAVKKTAQAIARTYKRLGLAEVTSKELYVRLREGSLDALVFVLHREYPEPGMYPLRDCLEGHMHTWLFWSQDWIKKGLYRLREKNIISKVSEIDSVRQFSTRYRPEDAVDAWLGIRDKGQP